MTNKPEELAREILELVNRYKNCTIPAATGLPTVGHQSILKAEQLAQMVIDKREAIAMWAIKNGYATGHGDTSEDILDELKAQIEQEQREKDARIAEGFTMWPAEKIAKGIRDGM